MEYVPPYGKQADAPYRDADAAENTDGSVIPAAALEHTQREIVNAIKAAGLTPDADDLTQLAQVVGNTRAHTHDAADITGILPVARGGTGNAAGLATSAIKLETARTIRTNLASTSTVSFDGSVNILPGVSGTLSIANGGTGATTTAAARTNLGITEAINAMPLTRVWVSDQYEIATMYGATNITVTHNLGISSPERVIAYCCLQCVAIEGGYSVGDLIRNPVFTWRGTSDRFPHLTNPIVNTDAVSVSFYNIVFMPNKTDATSNFTITASNWRLIFIIHY